MSTAIVFYSLEGNTELIAGLLAERCGGDLIKLEPEKENPKDGFKKFLWGGKSAMFHEKPKLKNTSFDPGKYDTIMLGTPVWAGTYAPPMNTFLSSVKLENKKIVLFVCHAGGDPKKCFEKLGKKLEGNQIAAAIDFKDPGKDDIKAIRKKVEDFTVGL